MRRLAPTIVAALTWSALALAGNAAPTCPPPDDDAAALLACGEQAIDQGRPPKAQRLLERALEIAEVEPPGGRLESAILFQLARLAIARDDFDAATAVYRDALERTDARVEPDDPVRIEPLMHYAEALIMSGSPAAAVEPARAAVELAEQHGDDYRDRLVFALRLLGELQQRSGDHDAAAETFRRVVDLIGWEPDPGLLGTIEPLAWLEADAGRVDASARAYDLAIRTYVATREGDVRRIRELIDRLARLGRRHERPDLVERAEWFSEETPRRLGLLDEPPGAAGVVYKAGRDGVTIPRRLTGGNPAYPEPARALRSRATVTLRVVLLTDGTVGEIETLRCSNPGLGFEEAAQAAVREWTYEPATLDGEPVAVYFDVFSSFSAN